MYYVWDSNADLDEDFSYFSNEPEKFDANLWISGKKISDYSEIIELTGDEDSPTKLSDLLLTDFQLQVFSRNLINLFNDLKIENIQYFPVRIFNHETGGVDESYKIANIEGLIDCLDIENSIYKRSKRSGNLLRVAKFKIVEEKIIPVRSSKNKPFIFRLGEFPRLIIVHETVKKACEDRNITGVEFISPEEYA